MYLVPLIVLASVVETIAPTNYAVPSDFYTAYTTNNTASSHPLLFTLLNITTTNVCKYCGETYIIRSSAYMFSFDQHSLVTFTLPDGTKYETCQTIYVRSLIKLTGAKQVGVKETVWKRFISKGKHNFNQISMAEWAVVGGATVLLVCLVLSMKVKIKLVKGGTTQ